MLHQKHVDCLVLILRDNDRQQCLGDGQSNRKREYPSGYKKAKLNIENKTDSRKTRINLLERY